MYFYRIVPLLACLCFSTYLMAQPKEGVEKIGKVSGRIIDEQKKPVEYATVTLLKNNNAVVNGALTDGNGNFTIEPTGAGNFMLRISGIGLTTRTIENISITTQAPEKKMGNLTVSVAAKAMKAVEVTGERRLMEMSIDKKVFNVEKNITTAGGSAADVLQNVPSLSVDVDGDILLRGKETTLLIDGKPATLLGGDVASALQALPGAAIESVEVITNPSAKYDAQGMSGIVNIITKKDKRFGLNGSVTAGAGTHNKYNGGINLNLKNNKWNVFVNSNFRSNENYHRITTKRTNTNGAFYNTFEDNNRKFGGLFNSIGAEYTVNKRTTVTLTQNLNKMNWGGDATSAYQVYGTDGKLASLQKRISDNTGGPLSTSTSLDYKHKFATPRRELTANVTFARFWVTREQHYTTYDYDSNEILMVHPIYQNAPGSGNTSSLNAQADFTTGFLTKTGRLDAGWKSQLYWFESSNHPTIDSGTGPLVDYLLLNNYNYTQRTHAAYANVSDQFGKWGYQAGVRLEYNIYEGTSLALKGNNFTNDYLSLFPSAYISYKLAKDQTIYLSYTRRTNRPGFMQLMPYVDLSNPQDTSVGNPALKPEFIHNTELNYSRQFKKGHMIMASAYYQFTQNLIERYRRFYPDGTSFTQPQNLNSGVTYGVELTGRAQIMPIWDVTANVNIFQNIVQGTNIDPVLDNSGFSWFGKVNTNLRLPAGFSLQVNGNYEAPKIAAQGKLQEAWWMDVAIRKSLLNNKANLIVNVSDIFNTKKYTTIYEQPDYIQSVYRDKETRIGNVTFTYRFGKSDMKNGNGRKKQNGSNNAPIPEKDRNNLKTDDNSDQGGY